MAKGKDYETTSDNWNVADSYSKIKIMKPLAEIDNYIKIAIFGTSDFSDEFMISPQVKINARIMALKRFHITLQMLINNATFGVKKKDKKTLDEWLKAVKTIQLDKISQITSDKEGRKAQSIKEVEFGIVLNILIDIHKNILTPLNDAGMIYPAGQDEWEMDYTI